jgi:large subunit ribosomal protein L9
MKAKQRNQIPKGKHGNMKLVLTEDVTHLGRQGDVVEVRPGYGRNYLVPRGMATVPTPHNLRMLERFKIRIRQAKEARVADLRALAEQINKLAGITIEANANDEGHLYGSVGAAEVSKGLRGRNLPVDADMVVMETGIKETGLYEVSLNLGTDMDSNPIEAKVKVAVIKATK